MPTYRLIIDANGQLSIPVPGEARYAFHGTEPVTDAIARLIRDGHLDPDCSSCVRAMAHMRVRGDLPMGPSHRASQGCLSGKHAHCTCDTCF
jgi:hypothetical protein